MVFFGKIGSRLLRWFLIVALIPLIFMGYQGYYFAKQAVTQEVFLHMETVATRQMKQINQWFAERVSDLEVLAAHPFVVRNCVLLSKDEDASLVHELAEILRSYKGSSAAYEGLCIHDMNGRPLAHAERCGLPAPGFGRTEMFKRALLSDGPVKGPIHAHESFGPVMNWAVLIRSPAGEPVAIIAVLLALSNTLNPIILDTTGLGLTGQAYLVDTAKVMLTPSRFMEHPAPLTHKMDTEGIRRALTGVNGAAVYRGFDGQQVMGAWLFSPEQNWALIAEMDAREAFAPLTRLRRNALIVAILVLGVILIVVALISRSISLPIRQLADASLDVSKGNLERAVVVRLHDELGELAERFNQMVHSMKESRDSLQDAYEKLVRTQKQLIQSEKLAAIGEFVASIVHEIRNPLSAVKMNLRILETKCSTDGSVGEHFQLATSQTERLEKMMTSLLDYAKPIALNRKPLRLEELMDGVLRETQAQRKAFRVEVKLHDSSRMIQVDSEKIHQVLLNVLLNALQASNPGDKIILKTEDTDWDDVPACLISVKDEGHGIAPENMKKLFEPFFTTHKQGTGLGLPNSKKIVEAHGGTMRIRSRVGEGTEVDIIIPMET